MEFLSIVFNIADEGVCIFVSGKNSNSVSHDFEVTRTVQLATLSENQSVVEVELIEFELLVGILSNRLEDFFNHFSVVEEGWSKIELESITFDDLCSTSDLV